MIFYTRSDFHLKLGGNFQNYLLITPHDNLLKLWHYIALHMHYRTLLIRFSRDGVYHTVGGQADIGFKVCTMVYTAHMCAHKLGLGARTST